MEKKRVISAVAAALVFVLVGWLYFTPRIAFNELHEAIAQGNETAIANYVDFPALRISVKENIRNSFMPKANAPTNVPFAGFRRLVADALLDPIVERVISPVGLAAMMQGRPPDAGSGGTRNSSARQTSEEGERVMGYEGLNQYAVTYVSKKDGKEVLTLIMSRHGLASWRLSSVRFG